MRSVGIVVILVFASHASAQPAPEPYKGKVKDLPAAPKPEPEPYKGNVGDLSDVPKIPEAVRARYEGPFLEAPFRYAFGGGASGPVIEHRDQAFTLGFEMTAITRLNALASAGVHGHIGLRNWKVIGDFYSRLADEKPDESIIYGYIFGWLAGTGMLALGPEIVLGRAKRSRPWISFGTSFFLFIDTRDPKLDNGGAVLGHGGKLAAGYDFTEEVGIGIRVLWAPSDGLTIFGTTGPSILQTMAMIEIRGDHRDKKKK